MSNLLSKNDYVDIAAKIQLPTDPFIDGRFQKSKAGMVMESINPATGSVITNIAACDDSDVNYAVKVSRDAFNTGEWANKHPSERKAVLLKLAQHGSCSSCLALLDCCTRHYPAYTAWYTPTSFNSYWQ